MEQVNLLKIPCHERHYYRVSQEAVPLFLWSPSFGDSDPVLEEKPPEPIKRELEFVVVHYCEYIIFALRVSLKRFRGILNRGCKTAVLQILRQAEQVRVGGVSIGHLGRKVTEK